MDRLLEEFPHMTKFNASHLEMRHNTTHHIRTTPDPTVACCLRLLHPDLLTVTKTEFNLNLQDDTARRADPPW